MEYIILADSLSTEKGRKHLKGDKVDKKHLHPNHIEELIIKGFIKENVTLKPEIKSDIK